MKTLIRIPNLPFAFLFALFVACAVLAHTSQAELELGDHKLTNELKERLSRFYPARLKTFIAIIAYSSLLIYFLNSRYADLH